MFLLYFIILAVGGVNSLHIAFVGDSLLRYQYLCYVWSIHFNVPSCPPYLVNENLHQNWSAFYANTTDVFEGAMICDCWRLENTKIYDIIENRFYSHPTINLQVTYIEKFGDLPARGHNYSNLVYKPGITGYSVSKVEPIEFVYSWIEIFHTFIPSMSVPVEAVILNAGFHPHRHTISIAKGIIETASNDNKFVTIWAETTPVNPICPKKRIDIDSVVNKMISIRNETMKTTDPSGSPNVAYVAFPHHLLKSPLTSANYWDCFHFNDVSAYSARSHAIMDVIDQMVKTRHITH